MRLTEYDEGVRVMPTTTTTLNREEIKANIEALNHQAQVADATMRVALQAWIKRPH